MWLKVIVLLVALVILSWSAVPSEVLLSTILLVKTSTSLHHSLGFFFSVEYHQFFTELLVRHTKLLSDLNKTSEAIDVVRVIVVDLFVNLKCFIKKIHPAVAGSNHELPFHFFHLDLRCSLEVKDSLFEHILFGIVHTEARDDINLCWVVSITLLIIMNSLELILFLLVEVTHLCKNLRVGWDLGDENIVPFEGLSSHSNELINMSNLVDNFITIWNDSVKFLESLKTLVVIIKSFVNQTKIVDRLNAISFDTNSLKEELLCSVIVFEVIEAVTLVDKSF